MEILLHSPFSTSTETMPASIEIDDAELYVAYADELNLLHSISMNPSDQTMSLLMDKINLLTSQTKSCVS